ncbi:MAG: PilX N-terminal domain-containing pilus assembly protein [Nitrospirota bacterium]
MRNPLSSKAAERGASLVTTLLLLISLSVLGIAALTASRTSTKVVANDNLHKQLYAAAEAGLEAGRAQMIQQAVGSAWDALLANPAPADQAVAVPGMIDILYQYQFLDDADEAPNNGATDANGMILVRSWGYIDSAPPAGLSANDAQVVLEAGFFRAAATANYAQENVDAGNTNATQTAQNVNTGVLGAF